MRTLLVSTYDMGRQPFGLASAAAALAAAGIEVSCLDLAKQRLDDELVAASDAVAFFLPMHTATRLAQPVIARVRALNSTARLLAFGLYAPLNAGLLREWGIAEVIGGEFEDDLVAAVQPAAGQSAEVRPADVQSAVVPSAAVRPATAPASGRLPVPRVQFRIPVRTALPPLDRYATLQVGPARKLVGYTEASRGCKHRCRHCPIVPVYDGRFRVVPLPVVLGDVRAQVEAGAGHVTFGDPDFFNGVRHAADLMEAFAGAFPGITYDVTIKVEHLLRHAALVPRLRDTGCLFVTTAVESLDDQVLARLEKGHTRADFEEAVRLCREAGVVLAPTFVPFTPWTTLAGYCELLQALDRLELVGQVAPIQLAIRLLVPEGSRLLELQDVRAMAGPYSPASLTYPWRHADARVDALQREIERTVGSRIGADRETLFGRIWQDAHVAAGTPAPPRRETGALPRAAIPYLNEPWYC